MQQRKIAALALALLLALTACLPSALAAGLTLTLPSALTRVEEEAFFGDHSLSKVVVPEGVTYIGPRAFADCGALTVKLPDTVAFIADDAFDDTTPTFIADEGSYAWAYAEAKGFDVRSAAVEPEEMTVFPDALTLGVGETRALKAEFKPEGAQSAVTWSSNKTACATVNADGVVTARATGVCAVTATAASELTASTEITVLSAPTSIAMVGQTRKMGVGEVQQLGYQYPDGQAGGATFSYADSSGSRYCDLTEDGLIAAKAVGSANITVTSYNGKSNTVTMKFFDPPTSLTLSERQATLQVGETLKLTVDCNCGGTWESSDDAVATVSNTGLITALKKGSATITATTYNGISADCKVTVTADPTSIVLDEQTYTLNVGQTRQLKATLSEGSESEITWAVEDATYATVNADGLLTALVRGTTRVKATTENGLYAIATVNVLDPDSPNSIALKNTPPTDLLVGGTWTPQVTVSPSGADAAMIWKTNNENVLYVNEATGAITALSLGSATVKGVSQRNPELSIAYKVTVSDPDVTLVIPARRTTIAEIEQNMAKIRAVRDSAYNVLLQLYQNGAITKTDYNTRKAYIGEAFDMYLFPWITTEKELYWNASNSENGAKDFKPDVVYYGLPYTQNNRHNTDESVVNAGYWKDSGKGYYVLNNSKFDDRYYPGNDCSSFVSAAIWGYSSSRATDTTYTIYSASYYVDISDWTQMRPGDLIVKKGHVLLFLYWADSAKTRFMLIEQGGDEAAINTVSANIRTVEYYQKKGYKVRRVKSLA